MRPVATPSAPPGSPVSYCGRAERRIVGGCDVAVRVGDRGDVAHRVVGHRGEPVDLATPEVARSCDQVR
jgi:hypothetical protein